jgi:hypothetical protein
LQEIHDITRARKPTGSRRFRIEVGLRVFDELRGLPGQFGDVLLVSLEA